tara:strand:+ start:2023 stop:2688 length:666 start_codon:yes stop_codon:yes gene_type:complete
VAILSSGGKDSTYAHWWATLQGWDVLALIRCKISDSDSMMFQIPATDIVEKQCIESKTEFIEFVLSGKEDLEIEELNSKIAHNISQGGVLEGLQGLVTGALRSDYQKTRIERMCVDLNIKSFSPLWHNNPEIHMKSLIDNGFEIMISSVSCNGLDKSWLGRILCVENYKELKSLARNFRFNVDGEGGEYETTVINAPHFSSKIVCRKEIVWEKSRGFVKFI